MDDLDGELADKKRNPRFLVSGSLQGGPTVVNNGDREVKTVFQSYEIGVEHDLSPTDSSRQEGTQGRQRAKGTERHHG